MIMITAFHNSWGSDVIAFVMPALSMLTAWKRQLPLLASCHISQDNVLQQPRTAVM